jgi:hypothetical protein
MKLRYQAETGPAEQSRGRTIQLFTRGIRRVIHGDAECWTTYLIIPRAVMVAGVRSRRAAGAQYHDCDWWTLVDGLERWIRPAGESGPGRPFAGSPVRIRSSRRFVVIAQSGGLDI